MRSKTIILTVVSTLTLGLFIIAGAATVERLTLPEMVKMSPSIVVGTVTDVSSAWNENHTRIFTTITMDVSESLKGELSGVITFKQLGGTVGDTRASVPGFPVFNEGSELLLFLNDDPSGYIPVVGLGQGKFDIFVNELTGEKMTANDVLGLETIEGQSLDEASTIKTNLSNLKKSVSEILKEQNR